MRSRFPTFGNKNILLYYFLTIFMNGWFILPNWVFYFAQYTSIEKVGLIDGISKIFAVFLDVPTGTVADVIGKKKALILGNSCFILACAILIAATNFTGLLIGNICMFIGFAFVSGTKEALLYDSLLDIKKGEHYDELLGKVNSIAICTTIFSIFAGGLLFRFNPRFTFVAWIIFAALANIVLLLMREPIANEEKITSHAYFSKLKSGFSSIFSKPFFEFILPVLFFSMLIKSYEGVIRQNTGAYFGFTGETFGYFLALISLPTLFVSYNYNKIVRLFKQNTEYLFTALYTLGFLIAYFTSNMLWGVASFLSIYLSQEMVKPYILALMNKNTDTKHRATALSTVSLFSEFPYMIVVLFLGPLLELQNIRYLYLGYTVLLGLYFVIKHTHRKFTAAKVIATS